MFFPKLSVLALVAPLLNVVALQFETPSDWTSGGPATIRWTVEPSDPAVFSIFLLNEEFNDSFAIANNIQTSLGTLSLDLPIVPARAGYTLRGVQIDNINQVFGESAGFSVGEQISTSTSSSTSTTSTSRATATNPVTTTPAAAPTTTSGFGVTRSNTNTGNTAQSSPPASSSAPATTSALNAGVAVKAIGGNGLAFMMMIASAALGMVVAF